MPEDDEEEFLQTEILHCFFCDKCLMTREVLKLSEVVERTFIWREFSFLY